MNHYVHTAVRTLGTWSVDCYAEFDNRRAPKQSEEASYKIVNLKLRCKNFLLRKLFF